MKNRAVLVIAVLVALAAIVQLTSRTAPEPPPAASNAGEPAAAAGERTQSELSPDEQGEASRSIAPTGAAPNTATDAAKPSQVLAGSFEVIDEYGQALTRESGRFSMVLKHGETSMEIVDPTVQDGTWRVVVERVPKSVYVVEASFAGKVVRGAGIVPIDNPLAIPLRGKLIPTLTLRVFADETGEELSGVCVATRPYADHTRLHPGHAGCEVRAKNKTSPVRFGTRSIDALQTFWVTAPNRAWQPIGMDTTRVHERMVSLLPGGHVLVTCTGTNRPHHNYKLRVYSGQSSQFICEVAPRPNGTRIEHLPTGSLRVALELNTWSRVPHVVASTSIRVREGQTCKASLTVVEGPVATRATAAGTLHIGESWGDDWSLQFTANGKDRTQYPTTQNLRQADMQEGPPREYAWRMPSVLCATYEVFVKGPDYRTALTVPVDGLANARIVVPEPATIDVRVVDRDHQELALGDSLPKWSHVAHEWPTHFAFRGASLQPDGRYRIVAPAGTVRVLWHPKGYGVVSRDFLVEPGPQELQLEVARECGFEVIWREGSTTIPWPNQATIALHNAVGKLIAHRVADSRVSTQQSGPLTLSIPPIAGYLPIQDRNVFVRPADWTTVEVQLVRKH